MKLESKERFKKYEINEEAISKVSIKNIKGLDSDACKYIENMTKLALITSKNENSNNEVSIVFSLNERDVIGVAKGDEHSVTPESNSTAFHLLHYNADSIIVLTHNHPGNQTFSFEDFLYFLRFDSIRIMVVVTNLGKVRYIQKDNNYNSSDSYKLLNEYYEKYKGNKESEYEGCQKLLSKCYSVGIVYK